MESQGVHMCLQPCESCDSRGNTKEESLTLIQFPAGEIESLTVPVQRV